MIEIGDDIPGPEEERSPVDVPDLPPEYCRYRDEGCELADSCLNCPFPRCLLEEPGGKRRWLKKIRDRKIKKMFEEGSGTAEIGKALGLSRRTIQRSLKSNRYARKGT